MCARPTGRWPGLAQHWLPPHEHEHTPDTWWWGGGGGGRGGEGEGEGGREGGREGGIDDDDMITDNATKQTKTIATQYKHTHFYTRP